MLASSRKHKRDSLNFLRYPLARPVSWHRFLRRTGDELRDILLSVVCAANRSSSVLFKSRTIFFNSWRLSHLSLTRRSRLFCFAIEDFLAIPFHYFLRPGPFCLCLRLGSILLITYTRPRRRTILSPLEESALMEALTFITASEKLKVR